MIENLAEMVETELKMIETSAENDRQRVKMIEAEMIMIENLAELVEN
jgi:hypothetical protein